MSLIAPVPTTKKALTQYLSQRLFKRISLSLSGDRSQILRYEDLAQNAASLRLDRAFLHASSAVLGHLVAYLSRKERRSLGVLRLFVEDPFFRRSPSPQKQVGLFYDLEEVYLRVQSKYLPSPTGAGICWFQERARKQVASLTYGFFSRRDWLIQINRTLDSPKVPLYFLEYIIYHEALHALFPPHLSSGGRILVHTKAFKEQEQKFPYFSQAKQFGQQFFQTYRQEKMLIWQDTANGRISNTKKKERTRKRGSFFLS
ncbi:MAG: hypothetical protein AAGF04_03310 [Chlamydiota bacterium]